MNEKLTFSKGLKDGIPICLGYLSVSFTFGMKATMGGLPVWVAVLISMTNLTSAGQFAGTSLILSGGTYLEVAVTTFVINIRYMLMSLSLSQKVDERMTLPQRLGLSFGVTDEIFAVSMQQKGRINAAYLTGLILTPYAGWAVGTFCGAAATGVLPAALRSALGIAIYGMFLAIIIPPATKMRPIAFTVLLAAAISCLFRYAPVLSRLSSGWVIIICAVAASAVAAKLFPVLEDSDEGGDEMEDAGESRPGKAVE